MSAREPWEDWLSGAATERRRAALDRTLRITERSTEPIVYRDGREMINLSSNNYLGLAGHAKLVEAAKRGAERGAGSGSSPLSRAEILPMQHSRRRLRHSSRLRLRWSLGAAISPTSASSPQFSTVTVWCSATV